MTFDRNLLPSPMDYFESQGLVLKGPRLASWKTTRCNFHGGSDSMRIQVTTGAWVCMSCGEKGGDVLAYEMKFGSLEFIDAAKSLGCWIDDGRRQSLSKPTPLSPRQALSVMAFEATLVFVAAGNVANGVALSDADRARVMVAVKRITRLVDAFK